MGSLPSVSSNVWSTVSCAHEGAFVANSTSVKIAEALLQLLNPIFFSMQVSFRTIDQTTLSTKRRQLYHHDSCLDYGLICPRLDDPATSQWRGNQVDLALIGTIADLE